MSRNSVKYALFIVLGYNAAFGIVFGVLCSESGKFDAETFRICMSGFNGVGAAMLLVYLAVNYFRNREAMAIYKQKGICDEYAAALSKRYSKLSNLQLVNLANVYMALERFNEAERVLNSMPGEALLHGPVKLWYYKSYIWLYLCTGRYQQALDIFDASRDRLEKFFGGEGASASSFYDDAAICMAIRRDFAAADAYRNRSVQATANYPNRAYNPYMIMAELFMIDGNEAEAMRAADSARQAVFSCVSFKYPWERDDSLRRIDMGLALARKIRADLYGGR